MSDALEGNKEPYDGDTRVLFAPPGIVSYETMREHGLRLIKLGYTVWIHEHKVLQGCVTPDGAVGRCGRLTVVEDRATLVPSSKDDN